jgi:hypothetical protein
VEFTWSPSGYGFAARRAHKLYRQIGVGSSRQTILATTDCVPFPGSPFSALIHRMTNSQRLATVRDCLVMWIAQQTGSTDTIASESILIRDDFYCGRRFRTANYTAVWFTEQDELKIYRVDGGLQCVLVADQIDAFIRTANESDADRVEDDDSARTLPMVARRPASDDSIRRAA